MLGALLLACAVTAAPIAQPTARIDYATLVGKRTFPGNDSIAVDAFLGIPYAQAPVKELRFALAVPVTAQIGTLNASSFKPACMQSIPAEFSDFYPTGASEDCLYINVWTPPNSKLGDDLPVMVWTHGGYFTVGGTAEFIYNGANTVYSSIQSNQKIIFVSYAYRLSVFGFSTANLGLLDQKFAFEWIRKHIHKFGGDRKNVAAAGESAGAFSIGHHMTSSLAILNENHVKFPLFDKAILQSGAVSSIMANCSALTPQFSAIVSAANCTNTTSAIECLRKLSPEALLAAGASGASSSGIPFQTCIDGSYLLENPFIALSKGKFAKIPLLTGYNTNEGTAFAVGIQTAAAFDALVPQALPYLTASEQADIYTQYPLANYSSPFLAASALFGDFSFVCPSKIMASAFAAEVPTFSYCFNKAPNATTDDFLFWGPGTSFLGASHGSEIIYTFDDLAQLKTDQERALAKEISSYWISFVHSGNPNKHFGASSATVWPLLASGKRVRFDEAGMVIETAEDESNQCGVWKRIFEKY